MDVFFHNSDQLDYLVLRPLSHYTLNWELTWDFDNIQYFDEKYSFAKLLNELLLELTGTLPQEHYHKHEDLLAEKVITDLKWPLTKIGKRWVGESYDSILSQGGFGDYDQINLLKAAAGRIKSAKEYGHKHFDEMELGHQRTLAFLLTAILYHRSHLVDFEDDDI